MNDNKYEISELGFPFFFLIMDIGNAIQHARKSCFLTQNELADKLDIDQSYLSLIENNKKKPSLNLVEKIGKQTGFPVPILFFLSLSEDDVPENKKDFFKLIYPSMKKMISDLYKT